MCRHQKIVAGDFSDKVATKFGCSEETNEDIKDFYFRLDQGINATDELNPEQVDTSKSAEKRALPVADSQQTQGILLMGESFHKQHSVSPCSLTVMMRMEHVVSLL